MDWKFEYQFQNHGETKEKTEDFFNEIWLDTGSRIDVGVFDHHNNNKEYKSTVDVLFNEISLLDETRKHLNPELPVKINLHKNPDTDALFAAYLVKDFIKYGREKFEDRFLVNGLGERILEYVNDIDSGKNKEVNKPTLYCLITLIDVDEVKEFITKECGKLENNAAYMNKEVEIVLEWIDRAVKNAEAKLATHGTFDFFNDNLADISNDKLIKVIDSAAKKGKELYELDKRNNNVIKQDINIWTMDGEIKAVPAVIWRKCPESPIEYILARAEGAILTYVPQEKESNKAIISINPQKENAVGYYSLTEVADFFEQLEQIYDKEVFEREGKLPRDYSSPRGDRNTKVFLKKPFSMTKDPWYVSEIGDIIDCPSSGTKISIDEQIEILMNITKMVKSSCLVKYDLSSNENDLSPIVEQRDEKKESLLNWMKVLKEKLNNTKDAYYPLVIAEVDAALISRNNNILDAYFMSISDGSYLDVDGKSVFRINYRTHLYVNQSNAVLFIATSDHTSVSSQMEGMLNWESNAAIKNSDIIKTFSKILYQREQFKRLGRFLGDYKNKGRKEINRNYEQLIELLAQAEADECIDTQIELDIYEFIYDALNIQALKETVKDTFSLVSGYSSEKVYASLNWLSVITIPFILLSTLIQINLISLKPIFSDESCDGSSIEEWIIFFVITLTISIFLFNIERIKRVFRRKK